jgi:1,4-dihydroxy-2-naphthoate octaprenyltransferase
LLASAEFLIAAVLFHTGFSFIRAGVDNNSTTRWARRRLFLIGIACITAACLIGLHLNRFMSGIAFLCFGIAAFFTGVLYVMPPLSFYRRAGGEIILAYGLGMLPVLGAYLIQVNDLTRKVYLVSLPLVAATGLWVFMEKLTNRTADTQAGRESLIDLFGLKTSGRYITIALMIGLYSSLLLAIFAGACTPLAGMTFISVYFAFKIVKVSWNNYADGQRMFIAKKYAIIIHLIVGSSIIISSLISFIY